MNDAAMDSDVDGHDDDETTTTTTNPTHVNRRQSVRAMTEPMADPSIDSNVSIWISTDETDCRCSQLNEIQLD
jgi:hypothetical protein